MGLSTTKALSGLADRLKPGVSSTPSNPDTRSGSGIDIHTPVGGASAKDVSADRTNYDAHANVPGAHAGVQFGEDRKTKAIDSGHVSLGFGSGGKGVTVDGGFDGCTASVGVQANIPAARITIPGGPTIGVGIPTPHLGVSFPIPGCNPKPPPPYDPKKPPSGYKTLEDFDFDNCGVGCAVVATLVTTFNEDGTTVNTRDWEPNFNKWADQWRKSTGRTYTEEDLLAAGSTGADFTCGGYTFYIFVTPGTLNIAATDSTPYTELSLYVSKVDVGVAHSKAQFNEQIQNFYPGATLKSFGVFRVYTSTAGCPILPDNVDRNSPPPPNPRNRNKRNKEDDPMGDCCQTLGRQNDDLKKQQDKQNEDLALLKKQVQAIYNVLNPEEFNSGSTSVPKRLLYPGASGQESIKDYPHLLAAIVRQIDTATGYFPMEVVIADANPTKGVNQSMKLKINSLADGIKLVVQHLVETEGDTDATLNFDIRTAYTLVAMQQEVAKIGATTTNIQDYLGYKVKHNKTTIPCVFNPFVDLHKGKNFLPWSQADIDDLSKKSLEEVIPQLLKERDIDVKTTELDEKKLLNESLLELLRGVQACRGALTHEYKGESELKQFLDLAVSTRQLGGFFHREDIRQVLEVGDMNNFQHDVEEGYTGTAQNADINIEKKPYNKSPANKPRIKNISKRRKKGK